MEEAGLEEGLCDSVIVAVSAMDKTKMCPAEELKGKEPEAELENCHPVHNLMPYSLSCLSLNHHFMCRDIRALFVRHSIACLSSLNSLDLKLCQPIYADIKPSNVLLKDSRPKQVNMNNFSDFPPGFRFNPDEEVISNYLRRKSMSRSIHDIVKEHVSRTFLDFNDNTWSLPDICLSPKREWYFFSYRERKYHTTLRTLRVQNPWGKRMDGYSQRRLMKKPEAKMVVDYMKSGSLSSYDPLYAFYDSSETFAMKKMERHQTGVPVEKKKIEDILRYPAASIPEVWETGNARARADFFHAEVLWLEELAKRQDHSCWRKAELAADYMNGGSHSVDITYASNVMKTRGERLFYDVQSYKGANGKIANWPLNIFQRGCRKSSALQKVWLQENKIVSWSSASYLLLLIFSLYATTTLVSSMNSQKNLIDGNRTGKHELNTNQLLSGLEGDVIRPTGSFYDQKISEKYMSWTFSSFSFLLLPTALLVAILLVELHLESRMSNESYQVDCGTYTEGGTGLRGHKQKHSQSRDAGITKGITVSPTRASYALLLIALLSTMLSMLVALNFRGSISDGSYPGSFNLYRGWLFISINSTVFFTSVAVMVILLHELSLGTWLMTSTLSMLSSYACLLSKVVPFHGMPLLLLGIPSAMLARALRNAVSA